MVSGLTTGCEAEFWAVSTLEIKKKRVAVQALMVYSGGGAQIQKVTIICNPQNRVECIANNTDWKFAEGFIQERMTE